MRPLLFALLVVAVHLGVASIAAYRHAAPAPPVAVAAQLGGAQR